MLNRTVDDKLLNSFTKLDWEYYAAMILQDEEEEEKRVMNGIEYMALFVNPEAVVKMQEMKDNPEDTTNNQEISDGSVISSQLDDDEFSKWVGKSFNSEGQKPEFKKR